MFLELQHSRQQFADSPKWLVVDAAPAPSVTGRDRTHVLLLLLLLLSPCSACLVSALLPCSSMCRVLFCANRSCMAVQGVRRGSLSVDLSKYSFCVRNGQVL